jgi:hypothetical protein
VQTDPEPSDLGLCNIQPSHSWQDESDALGLHKDHFLCTLALRSASADRSAIQEGRMSSALHGISG